MQMEDKDKSKEIAVLGIPFDKNSSFRRGSALAPPRIRDALYSKSTNLWTETGIDLGSISAWQFLDNLEFSDQSAVFANIEHKIKKLLRKRSKSNFAGWRPFYHISNHPGICKDVQ